MRFIRQPAIEYILILKVTLNNEIKYFAYKVEIDPLLKGKNRFNFKVLLIVEDLEVVKNLFNIRNIPFNLSRGYFNLK